MKINKNILIFSLLAAFTFAGVIIWNLLGVDTCDDFFYRTVASSYDDFWGARGEIITTYTQAWESVQGHVAFVNGRLANLLHIFFQPLPRSVEAIFLAVVFLCMWFAIQFCAGVTRKNLGWGAMTATVLIWTALPWYDHFQSLDFQINYFLPSALCLFIAGIWPRIEEMKRGMYFGLVSVAFFTAWLHEGFSVVLLCFCGAKLLFNLKNRRGSFIAVALAGGLLVDLLLGTLNRAGMQISGTDYSIFGQFIVQTSLQAWPIWLATLIIAVKLWRSHEKNRKSLIQKYLPWLFAAYVGLAMALAVRVAGRALWPALIFAFVPIVEITTSWMTKYQKVLLPIGICFTALYAWWLAQMLEWQYRLSRESEEVMSFLSPRGSRTTSVVYADLTAPDAVPWYLFETSSQRLYSYYDLLPLYSFYNRRRTDFVVAPKDFEGLPIAQWPRIAGNAGAIGRWPLVVSADSVMQTLDFVFGPAENMPPSDRLLSRLKYPHTDTVHVAIPYWFLPQRTPDGETLYKINLCDYSRTAHHRPLLRIDTLKNENLLNSAPK